MNRIETTLLVFAFIGLSCSARAITSANHYDTIIDRNIFRLNPTPIATIPTNTDPVLDRKVDLSGISNIAGRKRAWFVVSPKAGSKDLPLYLNLSEGERQDFLEVVSITEEQGEVKVLNAGNSMVLSLKTNILKPQPVAPTPAAPVATPVVNAGIPAPVVPQPSTPSYGGETTTSYGGRGPVTVSGGTPTVSVAGGQSAEGTGLRTIPTRTLRLAPVANQPAANQPPVDPVTQRVMMEVDNKDMQRRGIPAPPLP